LYFENSTAFSLLKHWAAATALWRTPIRVCFGAALGSFLFVAAVLAAQALLNYDNTRLAGGIATGVAVAAAALTALCRAGLFCTFERGQRDGGRFRLAMILPSVPVAMFGVSLSLCATVPWVFLAWAVILVEEIVLLYLVFRKGESRRIPVAFPRGAPAAELDAPKKELPSEPPPEPPADRQRDADRRGEPTAGETDERPLTDAVVPAAVRHETALPDFEHYLAALDAQPRPANVDRTLTRFRTPDGGEAILGWIRGRFVSQQRTLTLHVEFCPPFPVAPSIQVRQVEGRSSLDIQDRCQPFGVRIDARRAGATGAPDDVLIVLMADCAGRPENDSGDAWIGPDRGESPFSDDFPRKGPFARRHFLIK
jgi:hypothetical protein